MTVKQGGLTVEFNQVKAKFLCPNRQHRLTCPVDNDLS